MSGLIRVLNRRNDLDEAAYNPKAGMIPEAESPMTMWFLGFDASCGSCADLATEVDTIAEGRIQIISLHHPAAREWRATALAPDAPWAPTLFRIEGQRIQAWTGPAMMANLARILGPRRSWRLAEMLGERGGAPTAQAVSGRLGRRQVLTGLSGVAAGLFLVSRAPTMASAQTDESAGNPEAFDEVNSDDAVAPYGFCGEPLTPGYQNWAAASDGANCRICANTWDGLYTTFAGGAMIYFRGYTTAGEYVNGSSSWFQTSGTGACWVHRSALVIY